jgi:hypothetical protein
MATGDIDRAARYVHALFRGEDGDEARAGAYLIADALVTVWGHDSSTIKWRGVRGGIR